MLEQHPGRGPHYEQLLALAEETGAVGAALLLLTAGGAQLEIAALPQLYPLLGQQLRAVADQLSPPPESLLWQRVQFASPN